LALDTDSCHAATFPNVHAIYPELEKELPHKEIMTHKKPQMFIQLLKGDFMQKYKGVHLCFYSVQTSRHVVRSG